MICSRVKFTFTVFTAIYQTEAGWDPGKSDAVEWQKVCIAHTENQPSNYRISKDLPRHHVTWTTRSFQGSTQVTYWNLHISPVRKHTKVPAAFSGPRRKPRACMWSCNLPTHLYGVHRHHFTIYVKKGGFSSFTTAT